MKVTTVNKPSWNDAPEWANYLAQDYDGTWVWYEYRPKPIEESNYFSCWKGKFLKVSSDNTDWKKTLEKRPK